MPAPRNIEAHKPYLDYWQRAVESTKGIEIGCLSQRDAIALRLRMSQARAAQRQHHKAVYPPGTPQHGLSYYEGLTTRIVQSPGGSWKLRVLPVEAIAREIAEL